MWTALAIGLVVLAAIGAATMWPTGPSAYREEAVSAAQDSLAAVRTVVLVADAREAGEVTGAYTTVILDDARTALATAQSDLSELEAPDRESVALRDELGELVQEAAGLLGDADTAWGSRDRLAQVGDRLAAFVVSHR